jgi:hypothetical protein
LPQSLISRTHQHPWIETEKQFFGRRHTDYDFEAKNPNKCQQVRAHATGITRGGVAAPFVLL